MEFNLREKTVVLLGPFSTIVQNLMLGLSANGADVVFIDNNANQAQKFCTNINDMREANDKLGRAICQVADLNNRTSIQDAIGKAASTFGSVDIYVDAMLSNHPSPFPLGGEDVNLDQHFQNNLKTTLIATQFVVNYLKGRKRGRVLYLLNDSLSRGIPMDACATAMRTGLIGFASALGRQVSEFQITVNCLSLGLSEEYLLGHFPDSPSIKEAVEKMKSIDPLFKITEPDRITNTVLFLLSAAGSAINGQHLRLT